MYNLHQFTQETQQVQRHIKSRNKKERFLQDREGYKTQAYHALKDRAYQFYRNQLNNPTVVPDQFCQRWNQTSTQLTPLNRSSFSEPRPSLDAQFDKTVLSEDLMMSSAGFQLQRSLFPAASAQLRRSEPRSRPKDEFKLSKEDKEWLRPQPLYHMQSADAMNKSGAQFKEKAMKLRSKLLQHKAILKSAVDKHLSRYDYTSSEHKHCFTSAIRSLPKPVKRNDQSEQPQEGSMCVEKSEYQGERGRGRRRERTYFKLAKTMQLQSTGREKMEWSQCLGEWQCDRRKGITKNAISSQVSSVLSQPI